MVGSKNGGNDHIDFISENYRLIQILINFVFQRSKLCVFTREAHLENVFENVFPILNYFRMPKYERNAVEKQEYKLWPNRILEPTKGIRNMEKWADFVVVNQPLLWKAFVQIISHRSDKIILF